MQYDHPLLDQISGGALDDYLPQLDSLVRWRRKVTTHRKGIVKNATVTINCPGDARIHGRTAKVNKINQKTVSVTLLDATGAETWETWRLSPSLIDGAA